MRRPGTLLIGSAIGILGVAAVTLAGCGGSDSTTTSSSASVNVTLAAADGRLSTDRSGVLRLTLRGVDPRVEVSDVSPGTGRSWEPTWAWARSWKTLYKGYEPNTTISWGLGRARQRTTVALVNGTYKGRSMVFEVRPLGSTDNGPLPPVAAPRRAHDLGPVQVFVDPPMNFPGSSFVQQELSGAAGIGTYSGYWNAGSSRPIVPPAPGGQAYKGITAMSNQVVVLELQGNVAFASGNLPGRTVVPINNDGIGGYFEQLNLTGGSLNLAGGQNVEFVGNNVFDGLNLTNGTLVPPSQQFMEYIPDSSTQDLLDAWDNVVRRVSDTEAPPKGMQEVPTGNSFIRVNLSGATVKPGYLGDSLLASVNLDGATWSSGIDVNGTALLGADFSGAKFAGTASFAGSTIAPVSLPTADGAITTNSSFRGQSLGTSVSFGSNGATDGALLVSVDFSTTGLQGTDFAGTTINGGTFADADLGASASANFNGAAITGADFTGTQMGGSSFENAVISGVDFSASQFGDATVSFQGARISGTTQFPGTLQPTQVSFAGAKLDGVTFTGNPSAEFVAATMSAIASTGSTGVQMGETTYIKQGTTIYQVTGDQWQPLELQGTQLVPQGDPVAPAGGGGNNNQPPDPAPDSGGGGGDNNANNANDDGSGGEPVGFGEG